MRIFVPDFGFFVLHSRATELKNRLNMGQKDHFAANWKKFKRLHY